MTVPNNLAFAKEARAAPFPLLWKTTLVFVLFLVGGALILFSLNATNPADLFLPIVLVAAGCIGCRELLRRDRYVEAVWSYIITLMIAVAIMSHTTEVEDPAQAGRLMILFVLPLGILLVGFLLPARSTVLALGLAIILTLIVPTLGQPFVVTRTQILAIILMLIAVGIAAQMSGALYGIAEWALESYRKERETKEQLFDSQQEIQRSFMRQKALAEQLQETNVELEAARAAAIQAKNFRGQFLANMSHELRTPLNAMIGFSETMLNFPMMYENQPPTHAAQ